MAAQDYDSQLLESVAVRRRRLRDAVVFGGERQRRGWDERLGKVFGGIVIGAVLCAGCVGWSFVSERVLKEKPGVSRSVPRSSSSGVSEMPSVAPSSR
ncbi:hypothetical protein [Streptomyces sp. AN091965]|uniref:hypothetical protein n=1 Tax=Streptomyces sp. AN091965 TaxID=2927803 RepID=UPI001F61EBBA|nr:hypothetical protein [Streptomyces sp. AN091965]MCI3932790.1 hypothetical protein [Streptomyces sp. AN091965]